MTTKTKVYIGIAVAVAIIIFFLGRATINTTEKIVTKYLPGKTVYDTIKYPVPYAVITPSKPEYLYDTIIVPGKPNVIKIDTAAILKDWTLERNYSQTSFNNDTIGTYKWNAKIQYNKLVNYNYTYTPIQKQITKEIIKTKLFSPYVNIGYWLDGGISAETGVFIMEKVSISAEYKINANTNPNANKYNQLGLKLGFQF
jgi:hypothetical protein